MDAATAWRDYFAKWPKDLPRRGVLVVTFGEQIPFDGFLTTDNLLLVERRTPDSIGARKVIIPFGQVQAIKLIDVVPTKSLRAAGFTGDLPGDKS